MEELIETQRRVAVGSETVTVYEVKWKDYVRLIRELVAHLIPLYDPKNGSLKLSEAAIVGALQNAEGLVSWFVAASVKKEEKWVDELPASQLLPLLNVVVKVHLSEELVSQGKALAEQMRGAFGLSGPSPAPSTTSSSTATASKT
jgi:hypothetical protein